jgi:hypothetical protein
VVHFLVGEAFVQLAEAEVDSDVQHCFFPFGG